MDEQERQHAWEWFQFHADQRLRAFNFFLLATGALAAGALGAVASRERVIGGAIGVIGLVVAAVFFALEVRNHDLVKLGRDLLKSEPPFSSLIRSDGGPWRHKIWLRLFICSIALFSVVEAAWACLGYPGA